MNATQQKLGLDMNFSFEMLLMKLIKYLIEGLAVAFVAFYIPQKKMDLKDITIIGVTAAATFAILDMLSPSTGEAVRFGAGFGIGANTVGFRPF